MRETITVNGREFNITAKALTKARKLQFKRAETIQQGNHDYLIAAFGHAAECGQLTPITEFLNGMPKGQRVDAMRLWAEKFFPITTTVDKETAVIGVTLKKKWKADQFKFVDADNLPYWKATVENKVEESWSLHKFLLSATKTIENRAKKGEVDEHTAKVATSDLNKLAEAIKKAEDRAKAEAEEARTAEAAAARVEALKAA